MSKLSIKVEFIAGTDIVEAVKEAKEKAELWGVAYVEFNFNRKKMFIGAGTVIDEVVKEYHDSAEANQETIVSY